MCIFYKPLMSLRFSLSFKNPRRFPSLPYSQTLSMLFVGAVKIFPSPPLLLSLLRLLPRFTLLSLTSPYPVSVLPTFRHYLYSEGFLCKSWTCLVLLAMSLACVPCPWFVLLVPCFCLLSYLEDLEAQSFFLTLRVTQLESCMHRLQYSNMLIKWCATLFRVRKGALFCLYDIRCGSTNVGYKLFFVLKLYNSIVAALTVKCSTESCRLRLVLFYQLP